jgi:hypothetical protein
MIPLMPQVSNRILLIAGLCLLFSGFAWDVIFAGIPYQDSTPEMTARYEFHATVASVIRGIGFSACLLAGLRRMLKKSHPTSEIDS